MGSAAHLAHVTCSALRGHGLRVDSSGMSASSSPDLGEGVAEPFRSDPQFWRSVCASADAVVLLGLAVAASALLGLAGAGAGAGLAWLPLVLPVVFLVQSAVASSRFHRGQAPLPARVDTVRGEQSWRDAERIAFAAVFGRALMRRRHLVSATPRRRP